MLFDTDVLIFVQRGNIKAAKLIEKTRERKISILTYMELLQEAKDKKQHKYTIDFLKTFDFEILPLTENIGHRAAVYVEEYSLSHNIKSGDAIIAATAVENGLSLSSANVKHFKHIKELDLVIFRP
ncbi:MAG: type II toxin-antitoxin system VapC family toxin [Candidatus Aminicenantes bacterium]|jgi:predicted nucleic acid-binding protein